jgi:hypothetical protein
MTAMEFDFGIEELDALIDPEWTWGDFFMGFATGVALVGLGVAAAT